VYQLEIVAISCVAADHRSGANHRTKNDMTTSPSRHRPAPGLGTLLISLCTLAMLQGCATPAQAPRIEQACAAGSMMVETSLFFGLRISGGGEVSEREWQRYVASTLVPSFPEGFTIVRTNGHWRDPESGRAVSEPGRMVIRLHDGSDRAKSAVSTVIATYVRQFRQQSVMRTDKPACTTF
jgi:hypothetical protein